VTADSDPPRDGDADADDKLDEELEESFPASDPSSTWAARVDEDDEPGSKDDDRRA
jgi:hypothetical protein